MSWFAAKTKHKGEFKALNFFNSIGVNSYVPSYRTKKIWSDRVKKVTLPAISGYVFFELVKINFDLVNLNPYTKCVVRDVDGSLAIIKENEIATLKKYLDDKPTNNEINFHKGQSIKVCSGPLMFKNGIVNRVDNNKIVINIESININLILKKSSVVAA